ncbi:hypothetical protein FHS60_001534 [Alloprevotella rava]|uniref:Uncharacterized protein n=1 Tax=Alloprevotella rava TaxID=671218 RepID=A0A7W5YGF5_9BACT|nr:hypothetical protein [Alloprevotella rava]
MYIIELPHIFFFFPIYFPPLMTRKRESKHT